MYNCNNCAKTIGPRVPQKKVPVLRPDGNIELEYTVCPSCEDKVRLTVAEAQQSASWKPPQR